MVADVKDNAEAVREFYRRQGEQRERERIIRLLENQHNFDQIFLDAVDQVISLIKKEEVNVQTK